MQLMPGTARRFGVTNSFDARDNIEGGVPLPEIPETLFPDGPSGSQSLPIAPARAHLEIQQSIRRTRKPSSTSIVLADGMARRGARRRK